MEKLVGLLGTFIAMISLILMFFFSDAYIFGVLSGAAMTALCLAFSPET